MEDHGESGCDEEGSIVANTAVPDVRDGSAVSLPKATNTDLKTIVDAMHPLASDLTDARKIANEQWAMAAAALQSNPSLMTDGILKVALQNRPPLHVVRFMLSINPDAAGVPKCGPSALQVAVRHHASIDVIEALIRACPFALFTGNGSYDPLAYAKIWRREDIDLIKLLEKPISYWTTPTPINITFKGQEKRRDHPSCASTPSSFLSKDDQRELSNIKLIAATIIKEQKKQLSKKAKEQREVQEAIKAMEMQEIVARREQLKLFEEREEKSLKKQMIALDMRERAFESKVLSVAKEIMDKLATTAKLQEVQWKEREDQQRQSYISMKEKLACACNGIEDASRRIERATSESESRISDLAFRLDKESVVNAAFRNDTRFRQQEMNERFNYTIATQYLLHSAFSYPEPDISNGESDKEPLVKHQNSVSNDKTDQDPLTRRQHGETTSSMVLFPWRGGDEQDLKCDNDQEPLVKNQNETVSSKALFPWKGGVSSFLNMMRKKKHSSF